MNKHENMAETTRIEEITDDKWITFKSKWDFSHSLSQRSEGGIDRESNSKGFMGDTHNMGTLESTKFARSPRFACSLASANGRCGK